MAAAGCAVATPRGWGHRPPAQGTVEKDTDRHFPCSIMPIPRQVPPNPLSWKELLESFRPPGGTSYPFSIIGQLNLVDMDVEKDKKGLCYILSHKRCGYHESMFVTKRELIELREKIDNVLNS